jgi:hypothetical protein
MKLIVDKLYTFDDLKRNKTEKLDSNAHACIEDNIDQNTKNADNKTSEASEVEINSCNIR